MTITILGMGEIGQAIFSLLNKKRNVTIRPWDKNASKIPGQGTLQETIEGADLILLCTPSWTVRNALVSLKPFIGKETVLISLSKGLEVETQKTMDQLIEAHLPGQPFGILGGAMLAEELLAGKITIGVLGSTFPSVKRAGKKLFQNTTLRIVTTKDARGVALSGVLKNTYTLLLGIAEGLALGENAKGALFGGAVLEMRSVIKDLGGKEKTVLGPAGIGDFYSTGTSAYSRNRAVGIALSKKEEAGLGSEGLMSLPALRIVLQTRLDRYPLLNYLLAITGGQEEPKTLTDYFSRIRV